MDICQVESATVSIAPLHPAEPMAGRPHDGRQSAHVPSMAPVIAQRPALPPPTLPGLTTFPGRTRETAAKLHATLSEAYLGFRHTYYHEDAPTLAMLPPAHAEIHQAELARLAESVLRVMPPAVKSLAIFGGLIEHLQNVANLHSVSERERTALHNLTTVVLDGLTDGIQPWFIAWRLETARRLSTVADGAYYLTFPWEALLYLDSAELADLEEAARRGNVPELECDARRLAQRLIGVLHDPIGAQPDLIFVGPDADRQRLRFHLKTVVALGLAVYLVFAQARRLFNPPRPQPVPTSTLPPVPEHVQAHLLSHGRA